MIQLELFPELEIVEIITEMTEEEAKYLLCNVVETELLDDVDEDDEVILEVREAIRILRG
jgi:hypothetical protein